MQLLLVLFGILVHVPVTSSVPEGEKPAPRENVVPSKTEYERYLDQILLSFNDEKTREILKNATPEDIKNGLIEKTLRKIHPDIRSKLDEVKRGIIMEYRQKLRRAKMDDKVPEELHKFQDDDLKHLLKERHDRLKAMDSERQKQFKKYEMEKELKHRMALRAMNEYDRKVQEALDSEEKEKKMQKQKDLKHPGNKAQFEAQWEAEGFDKGSFNPKTFFMMHDLNGDGEWDFGELEAIFEKEVEELFEGFEADGEEISEEVARMREHVVEHMDLNDDGFIQIDEFLKFSEGKEWDHNDPWDTVFSFDAFDDSDFDDYEKNMDEEEKKELEDAATEERLKREITIKKYEDESKKNMDMLKEHSEQLKKAILEANKFRELEKAKKLVAEMAGGQPDAEQPQG